MDKNQLTVLTKERKGVIALVVLAFGFGTIAITARYLSYSYTLFQQLYVSLAVAFVISLFIFPRSLTLDRLRSIPRKDWLVMFFRVIFGYVIAGALYRESLTLTKISNVTFIQSIPFAGIFGFLLFREKFTYKRALFLLLAYIGVLLIAIKDYSSIFSFGQGEVYSFISAAFFSLSYVSRKWMSEVLTDKEIAQLLLLIGTILLFAVSYIRGEGLPPFTWHWLLLISLFFTGFFNAINIFLINYGFKNVKAVLASNILTLESIFALILATIFYREFPNLKELLGGALILSSVIQMNRMEEKLIEVKVEETSPLL